MSIQVFKSASNSVSTALNVVDSTVKGLGSMATIFEIAMAQAEQESIIEAIAEEKKFLSEHSVTLDEVTAYKSRQIAK